jgi:hypothetical protein
MRWGIFWRKLQFDIFQVGNIIQAAMLLHNFIIDERELKGFHQEEANFFQNFSLQDLDQRVDDTDEIASPVATDNNEPHPGGRPTITGKELQEAGSRLHDGIMRSLYGRGLGRRVTNDMRFNLYGQVYFANNS